MTSIVDWWGDLVEPWWWTRPLDLNIGDPGEAGMTTLASWGDTERSDSERTNSDSLIIVMKWRGTSVTGNIV